MFVNLKLTCFHQHFGGIRSDSSLVLETFLGHLSWKKVRGKRPKPLIWMESSSLCVWVSLGDETKTNTRPEDVYQFSVKYLPASSCFVASEEAQNKINMTWARVERRKRKGLSEEKKNIVFQAQRRPEAELQLGLLVDRYGPNDGSHIRVTVNSFS